MAPTPKFDLSASANVQTESPAISGPSSDISLVPAARLRIKGHEALIGRVCGIAKGLAHGRGLPTKGIRVRPGWSNECEDKTGVVVEVTLRCSPEDRFAYWEAFGGEIGALAASLSAEQSGFLNADVSLIVERV